MKSNGRVLRGWRDFGVKATAIILTILLATQMVGTPAFASGALTNKQASEDIATTVDDTGVEPSGTEATDTTVPDEAAGAANEPAPADRTQATEEPVVETVESATEPATETPAADPAANAVLGAEPEPAPAPAVEQDQLASIKLDLADGASITLSKDGNKIDDDTNPIEVPANEELKFTVQAAEGMQVSAVMTVIDNIERDPIAADENGEYTIAAEDVTDGLTVKVETSAVEGETPSEGEEASTENAAEAGDEESTDPAAAEGENATEESITPESIADTATNAVKTMVSEISLFAAGDESDTVEVTLKSVDGSDLGTAWISLGHFVNNAPERSGYIYDHASLNETEIIGVQYDETTDQYYGVAEDGQLAGIVLPNKDTKSIILYYVNEASVHDVTYEVYVKESDSDYWGEYNKIDDPATAVDFVGAARVNDGESYQFSFTTKSGYTLRESYGANKPVEISGGSASLSGPNSSGVYTVDSINGDVTIKIYLDHTSSYQLIFDTNSHNAELKYGNSGWVQSQQGDTYSFDAKNSSLSFRIRGYEQHAPTLAGRILNKLALN